MTERLAVATGGILETRNAKTGHGVLRYGLREPVAVIDARYAGRRADAVVPYVRRPVPVVATVADAAALGATTYLYGIAPEGGRLSAAARAEILAALRLGLHVEAGLHTQLHADPELVAVAAAAGVELRDLRAVPDDLDVPRGAAQRGAARVVASVGSDCAIGKMSATLELDAAARARGLASAFVPTGQTGVAIAGWGIAVDHVIADYVAGAAESLVHQGAARGGELLWLEGQGSLLHPAYSGVTLGLLHGGAPDALVLCHQAGQTLIDGYPEVAIPPLREVAALYEAAAAWVRPAPVVALVLSTRGLDEDAARAALAVAEDTTGLPTDDVVRFGAERLLDAVLGAVGPPG